MCMSVIIFFFKQKTAYELRISDWSSYVCSSDLTVEHERFQRSRHAAQHRREREPRRPDSITVRRPNRAASQPVIGMPTAVARTLNVTTQAIWRSEERRVGKECVSTC